MTNESTQKLAERIALLLQQESGEKPKDDFTALQATLEKINQRLDKIEAQFAAQNSNQTQHSALSTQHLMPHASQEKFAVAEAIVPEILEHLQQKEKACTFEPNGKPCDHCAMCNTRGF